MTLCFGKYKLRPFRRGDEPSIAANINDKKIERYTLAIPYPYGLKCARQWVKFNSDLARKKKRTQQNFAIDLAGEVIGGIGLSSIRGHKAEIGYWLGVNYWGRGSGGGGDGPHGFFPQGHFSG